ncbi:PREDICTED: uncharacterized protein LOC109181294 [Ipomoea nil]|uniref:uncharacterized protein LOC109181294 n=1 Tax=Ipomoea nil TaxID=35883 RepID=UPI0009009896|nr:PREDICTED: uncharacterized protein LOC109181294 [Ipomoea nil]
MEVAVIDWKNLDSRFVKDDLFENFNAPQWVDFSAPDDAAAVDDEAWFCRPDCNHPKTVEDFYNAAVTPTLEHRRTASVSEIPPLRERNRSFRDASLKNKGQVLQPVMSLNKDAKSNRMVVVGDSENQNPNFMTPPPRLKAKVLKEAIKSSMEREAVEENSLYREQTRRLRSTLSARNLFGGGGLMNKVSEFCNELKKLASRAREKERAENENVERTPTMVNKQKVKPHFGDEIEGLDEKQKERKPLLELSKEKQTKKLRKADAENTPIRVDVKNIKRNLDESLMQIRTSPPTPQCFSATKGSTPHNAPRSKPQERGILQELRQGSSKDGSGKKSNNHGGHVSSMLTEREGRGLDVLWFLKPCTLSS